MLRRVACPGKVSIVVGKTCDDMCKVFVSIVDKTRLELDSFVDQVLVYDYKTKLLRETLQMVD